MKPPIILCADNDVDVYETVAEAQRSMEAVDVKNDLYKNMFDSEGLPLQATFSVDQAVAKSIWNAPITLQPVKGASRNEHLLREVLIDKILWLKKSNPELINRVIPVYDIDELNLLSTAPTGKRRSCLWALKH